MAIIPIYIPTYINSPEYTPARVQPRLLFYNGMVDCESYYIESGSSTIGGIAFEQTAFPYFDNYNVVTGSFPTVNSKSLLFYNEEAVYGEVPTDSLYSEYWSDYVNLLYNSRTKLLNASAIIPLADYFKIELNDVVEFRGNYYHLRAINDYNLKNGECSLQLLGPILPEALRLPKNLFAKCFGYDASDCLEACYSVCECTPPCAPSQFLFSSVDDSEMVLEVYITGSNYQLGIPTIVTGFDDVESYPTLYTASWGDGSVSYVSGSNVEPTHTYVNPGTYEITLSGFINTLGRATNSGNQRALNLVLTKIKKWGSLNINTFVLGYNSSYLTEVPTGEPGIFSIQSMELAFAQSGFLGPNIPIYPADLFKYSINVRTMASTFLANNRITEIPENFLFGAPNVVVHTNTFGLNTGLTKLPNRLWNPNSNSNYRLLGIGMFRNTRSINSIPPNFFDAVSGSVNSSVYRMFEMATVNNLLTGSIPPIWNAPSASTWEVNFGGGDGIFGNCVSASNYNDIPAGWKLV
jgi:hypothetical protein